MKETVFHSQEDRAATLVSDYSSAWRYGYAFMRMAVMDRMFLFVFMLLYLPLKYGEE